jgi:hypothetical protein
LTRKRTTFVADLLPAPSCGRYRVSVLAKDAAGNKSRPRSVRLKVKR